VREIEPGIVMPPITAPSFTPAGKPASAEAFADVAGGAAVTCVATGGAGETAAGGGTGAIGDAPACRSKPATQQGLCTCVDPLFFRKQRASEL